MKSRSIQKTLPRLAILMILLFLILVVPMNIWLQLYTQHQAQRENVKELFGQLEQLLQTNEEELEAEREEFKERCIRAADVTALYVEKHKEIVENMDEMRELAEKLNVDEIHFFTPEGEIFSGTHPEYYGYNFESGEQMRFFRPMLQDKNLKLCQDITPNTAEGKEMQYAAVWIKDGSGIVQIGMEPRRLQQEMEEKSLKNIVAAFPFELIGYLHIADTRTQKIVASTDAQLVNKSIGLDNQKGELEDGFHAFHQQIDGKWYCTYTKKYKDYLLMRMYESEHSLLMVLESTVQSVVYVLLGALTIILIIRWYINHKLIGNLYRMIHELKKIENGDMENIVIKTGITEFDDLLFYINQMIDSIRLNWNKFSYIMDKGKIPIGIYDKNMFYKKTYVNERMMDILGIMERDSFSMEEKVEQVEKKLLQVERHEVDPVEHIYEYNRNGVTRYLRIEKQEDEQSFVYYVTDMSFWWEEMNQIKEQSEIDELTGLYNRRGFYEKMEHLFENSDLFRYAVMIMIDADDLKKINDHDGHGMGDEYLKAIAGVIQESAGEKAVCARLGGDEFVVFLHDFFCMEELEQTLSDLKLKRGVVFEGSQGKSVYTLQFSMGTAFYPMDGADFHMLMKIADENMYQEKKMRKGSLGNYRRF